MFVFLAVLILKKRGENSSIPQFIRFHRIFGLENYNLQMIKQAGSY